MDRVWNFSTVCGGTWTPHQYHKWFIFYSLFLFYLRYQSTVNEIGNTYIYIYIVKTAHVTSNVILVQIMYNYAVYVMADSVRCFNKQIDIFEAHVFSLLASSTTIASTYKYIFESPVSLVVFNTKIASLHTWAKLKLSLICLQWCLLRALHRMNGILHSLIASGWFGQQHHGVRWWVEACVN